MNATELNALAERVEKATGPDRNLDMMILARDGLWGVGNWQDAPAFTASLDAAMTLVPEGAWDHMEVYQPDHQTLGWTVYLCANANLRREPASGFGQSFALALTAACLRAHAASLAEVPA